MRYATLPHLNSEVLTNCSRSVGMITHLDRRSPAFGAGGRFSDSATYIMEWTAYGLPCRTTHLDCSQIVIAQSGVAKAVYCGPVRFCADLDGSKGRAHVQRAGALRRQL